jgi:hypothetical protein
MYVRKLFDAISVTNLRALQLAIARPDVVREYFARCLREYDGLAGQGLPHKDPIAFLCEQGWGQMTPDDRVHLPAQLSEGGGLGLHELVILAAVTRLLKPRKVFEFGTYRGLSTSAFVLNSPPDARVISVDLPPDTQVADISNNEYAPAEQQLIRERKVGSVLHELGLQDRYQQILCNSLDFDPTSQAGSVELGFIDGGHALKFVRNDTIKMARMMAERGLVFWHDYGGRGGLLALAGYLEKLSRSIPIYRLNGTALAWAPARSLKQIVAKPEIRGES